MSSTDSLRFFDLTFAKKETYMALSNKIDARLGEKFIKRLPVRTVMAILTGGTSLILSATRQGYQLVKKSAAIDAVTSFVDCERRARGCRYVEWNTFPESHIVIGGPPMTPEGKTATCPLCKRDALRVFVADSHHEIMSCGSCHRLLAIKVSRFTRQPEEVLIPGLFVAAIPFTHPIDHIGDLLDTAGDLVADGAEFVLDIFA